MPNYYNDTFSRYDEDEEKKKKNPSQVAATQVKDTFSSFDAEQQALTKKREAMPEPTPTAPAAPAKQPSFWDNLIKAVEPATKAVGQFFGQVGEKYKAASTSVSQAMFGNREDSLLVVNRY